MPRKLSIPMIIAVAVSTTWLFVARAEVVRGVEGREADQSPVGLSVRNLHVLVTQMPGQAREIRWSGVLDGFKPPPEGHYMDVACLVPTERDAQLPERYD